MTAPLIAVAHGTRDPEGPVVLERLVDEVRAALPGVDVRIAYVDVIGPTLDDVLAEVTGAPVVVPMFLAAGYHVRVDVPRSVEAAGGAATVAPAIGPDPAVVAAVAERLRSAGPEPDAVVLGAAGSSDARAIEDVEVAAAGLSESFGREVVAAYITSRAPTVEHAVENLRVAGYRRVGVASYLLAPGLFQQRLGRCGADVVAPPIGVHPHVVGLVAERYRSAMG